MKAVNLLPPELRRGGGGGAGHSGGLVYVLLGALGLLVVLTAAWALTGRQINDRKAEAARLSTQAAELERRAGELVRYEQAATAAKTRVDTVRSVANARFQWARILRDVSRVTPTDTWLTKMTGTIAPGVSVEGGVSDPLRGSLPDPALELTGCSRDQNAVAKFMADLRAMKNVTRVALSSSEKGEATATPSGDAASSSSSSADGQDCRYGKSQIPQFSLVVFFKGSGQLAASTDGTTPSQPQASGSSSATNGSGASSTPSTTTSTPPTTASTGAVK